MNNIAVLLLVTILQQPARLPELCAESTARFETEKGATYFVSTNARFILVPRSSEHEVLLRETVTSRFHTGLQQATSEIQVKAWKGFAPAMEEAWELEAAGDAGNPERPFYVVTKFGCCDELTKQTYFSLETGKRVMVSHSKAIKVVHALDNARFFAFEVINDRRGVLHYATANTVLQSVPIELKRSFNGSPELSFEAPTDATIWNDPTSSVVQTMALPVQKGQILKQPLGGFSVALSYPFGTIKVPINDDSIVQERIAYLM